MQQPPREPVHDPQPRVPPPGEPLPPIDEPEPDRLPDETPNPNPDENDEDPRYAVQDLVRNYGLSPQEAKRAIDRFGTSAAELDFILAGKGRSKRHRRQDIQRSAEEIAFG